jgi:hypothetical protein
MRSVSATLALLICAGASWAGVREVTLALPLRAKVAFAGHERFYIGPFVRERKGDEKAADVGFDVAAEFERYLRHLLRKETKFVLLPTVEGLRPPTNDPLQLAGAAAFWRDLGARTGADYIVAGSIDFEVQDRSGYQPQQYTSPIDGRTYYRQVLVEKTGFGYDILLTVYDARTGAHVLEEPLKDFQETQERKADEFTGMFANLYALENQIIGVFAPRTIKTKRVLIVP